MYAESRHSTTSPNTNAIIEHKSIDQNIRFKKQSKDNARNYGNRNKEIHIKSYKVP